ncbi:MAG: bifunctional UDP-sugar hydrolase/5'-nucleotidase [Eubacteriales bacterium]|nr:bifunctional UDP-sugar hydrolase/5'-nucleotidase [Eubacteriales bacterium]
MNKFAVKILSLCLCVLLISALCVTAFAKGDDGDFTVLFTHDLHSHFLPVTNDRGEEAGGYARLMTAINNERANHENVLLLDGGDFSMGSLFQTGFKDYALELNIMGKMGYDFTTFGNHEFDYLPEGLASMLGAAASSDEATPKIVISNYKAPSDTEQGKLLGEAFENYGVKDYYTFEKNGTPFLIFGIFGEKSHSYSPNSGMTFLSPAQTARKIVDEGVSACKEKYGKEPVVICLSHSGTEQGEGEDYALAKETPGIDLIISGHSHTELFEPIKVNDTYIVSAGEYSKNLGVARFTFDGTKTELSEYKLVPIDESLAPDKEIAEYIEACKQRINESYLKDYNLTYDEVLLSNSYEFDTVDEVYETAHESTLGNLFADAYKWAVEQEGYDVDVSLTASGVIRESIPKGEVRVSRVFDAASLGVGTEGELVRVYITGEDLKNAFEVDASVQPIMTSAQLFMSGVKYSFNQNRMIFDKVDSCALLNDDGTTAEIEDDRLYTVVTGMYVGQMLGTVESKSFGILKTVPRDEKGNPIPLEELVNYTVKDKNGEPIKEWYAIASYMQSMGGEMDSKYAQPDGRKTVYKSFAPADMLRSAGLFTYIALGLILLIIALIVFVTVLAVRKIRRRKKAKLAQRSE